MLLQTSLAHSTMLARLVVLYGRPMWSSYMEHLEHYFIMQGLELEDYPPSCMWSGDLQLALCLASARKLSDFRYAQLTNFTGNYFHLAQTLLILYYKFNTQNNQSNKSVADYITELSYRAELCKYNNVMDECSETFWCMVSMTS